VLIADVKDVMIMKTQSAKAKGRRFQQWVRDILIEKLNVHPEDVESRSMGAGGEDLIMARAAREKFPYSIECKNQESLNVWKSYEQAESNSGKYEPVVFIKRNNQKPLVVVDAEYFVKLHSRVAKEYDIDELLD
jgi:hypothetical protein|tara:strand:- start:206 stop:607 length:402 start_codon:yes stop_codon:yes gene_type:complete